MGSENTPTVSATGVKIPVVPTVPTIPKAPAPATNTAIKKFDMSNIKAEFESIRTQFGAESGNETFNCLIMGDWKTGKTTFSATGRGPVLYHGFDPGGWKSLREHVESGKVIVKDFSEQLKDPAAGYEEWAKEFWRLKDSGFFDYIGTYVIDSLTTFSETAMAYIMKKDNRPVSNAQGLTLNVPQIQDYMKQALLLKEMVKLCTSLPCDFILIAHISTDKDEVTGRIISTPMVSGKFRQHLPLLFDEVYVSQAKTNAQGQTTFSLLTKPDGIYTAGSRLSAKGQLQKVEEPNIKKILAKAGLKSEDVVYE
jgi:AAA domain